MVPHWIPSLHGFRYPWWGVWLAHFFGQWTWVLASKRDGRKSTERSFCLQCQGQPYATETPEWLAEWQLGNFQENYKAEPWKNMGYFFAPSCSGSFAAVSINFIDPICTLSSRAWIHGPKPATTEEGLPTDAGSMKMTTVPEGLIAGKGQEPAEAQACVRSDRSPSYSMLGNAKPFQPEQL